jgi:hypothetical protein
MMVVSGLLCGLVVGSIYAGVAQVYPNMFPTGLFRP